MNKTKNRLLIRLAVQIIIFFLVAALINAGAIFYGSTHRFRKRQKETVQTVLDSMTSSLNLVYFENFEWILKFWHDHYEDMDYESYSAQELSERAFEISERFDDSIPSGLSVEEYESLSYDEQLIVAEFLYWSNNNYYNIDFSDYGMEVGSTSRFLIPEENNKAFVVFETDPDRIQVTGAEVWEEYPKFGLGQRIDFNLDEHPIAKRSFETGEIIRDPEEYYSIRERKRLSSYYIPVTNGDKVMGIIQLSVDWSQNLRVIWQNAWQVEFVNVIVLAVVTVLILLLVKKLTDKVGALSGEQEKKNTELSIARKIQMQNLPNVFPAFPGRNDFDIYASNDPFLEVGGDFYDYFMIDDDHLAIVMADVSEKGVPAALFMMMAKTRIDAVAHSGEAVTPAKILEMTNDLLCENNDSVMFVTVWLGILTLSTGELVTANGGHLDPFICRNGEYKLCVEKHGLMLGAMEGQEYEDNVWKLSKGDTVFVCTDGLMEANDSGDEEFGNERLLDVLNRNKDAELSDILLAVKNSVYEYSGETGVFDDITMLAIRLK